MASPLWYNERMKERLHREIAWTIAHELNDPRIPNVVTVTAIKLAPDTRNATVYVSIYGPEEARGEACKALNGAAPYIQKNVATRISIKHFPKLFFKQDNSFDQSEHINSILERVKDDLV